MRSSIEAALSYRKYWWIVLFSTCIGLAVGAWKVASQKTVYVSTGRMMVSGKINLQEGATYSEEMSFFMTTQRELMLDEAVRQRASARVRSASPETPETPVVLSAAPLPQTSIFVLTATGEEPQYPQLFLSALMQEYIAARHEMRTQKSEDTEISIEDEIAREQGALNKEEEKLLAFQRANNVGFLEQEGNSAGAYLAKLNTQLADMKREAQLLDLFQVDQNLARDKNRKLGSEASPEDDSRGLGGPEIGYIRSRQQIEVLRAERDSYAKDLRPKHPIMVDLDHQIAQQQQVIEAFRKQSSDDLQRKRETTRLEIQNLEMTIKEWDQKALDLSQRLAEYNAIQSGVVRRRNQLESLSRSKGSVEINRNIDQELVSIRQHASVAAPEKPGEGRTIGTDVALGLLAGLLCLVLIDQLDDRIASRVEFQANFRDRVLGQIPRVKGTGHGKLSLSPLSSDDDRHSFSEAFRSLRSSLIFLPVTGEPPKILLIASAVPDEGKSTVAVNFAITLALSGARVLLVDGDLRRGELHRVFGLPNEIGFGDVLAGDCARHAAIQMTSTRGLSLLPRGGNQANPGELYLSKATDYFLKAVYREYDYVVIDSAPVMAADDTTSLAPKAEAAIFVFRFGASSTRASHKALQLLRERQANVIGAVCNDVSDAMQEYYHRSYPEYYTAPKAKRAEA